MEVISNISNTSMAVMILVIFCGRSCYSDTSCIKDCALTTPSTHCQSCGEKTEQVFQTGNGTSFKQNESVKAEAAVQNSNRIPAVSHNGSSITSNRSMRLENSEVDRPAGSSQRRGKRRSSELSDPTKDFQEYYDCLKEKTKQYSSRMEPITALLIPEGKTTILPCSIW